jgi:hypothetical protein
MGTYNYQSFSHFKPRGNGSSIGSKGYECMSENRRNKQEIKDKMALGNLIKEITGGNARC